MRRAETHYPLDLVRCGNCTLVQLAAVPDPAEVFPADYPYSSGNSLQLHHNFENLAKQVSLEPDALVVDIGANDGTLLRKFPHCRTVGVEPTDQAGKIDGPKYQEPFTESLARRIVAEHGPAHLVTACNVLAHVEDIDDVMRGINYLLFDSGRLIAENGDLAAITDGAWDFVYHEHLRYYSPYSFHRLLQRHGFGWQGYEETPTHGGSFRVFARKGGRDVDPPTPRAYDFTSVQRSAGRVRRELRSLTAEPVWGIGATARATTVINYCGLDVEDVECVCEVPTSDKIGRYIPGTRIPVVSEERLYTEHPPRVLLFSWHLADIIVPKLREHGYDGEVIVPHLKEATHVDLAA